MDLHWFFLLFFFCEDDLSEKPEAVWLFPPGQTLAKQKANSAIVWEQLHVLKEAAQRTCVTHCNPFTSRRGREGGTQGGEVEAKKINK